MERINKVLARSTDFSRREIDKFIMEGRIKVDGKLLTTQGIKVSSSNQISIDETIIKIKKITELNSLYIFHKPRGCLVTKSDDKNRKTVYDFLGPKQKNLLSIGRLDYNTEGLLLFTDNGEFKRKMELPKNNFERVYKVRVQGFIDKNFVDRLSKGLRIKHIKYKPIKVSLISKTKTYSWIKMSLLEGKNREIRNIFESLNITVTRLIRISYGAYKLGSLERSKLKKVKIYENY